MKLNNNDDSHNSGLNLLIYNMLLDIESHPAWVCGLKPSSAKNYFFKVDKSHPAWVCGLKRTKKSLSVERSMVTPCVGVWIETSCVRELFHTSLVTPCVGVWIETNIVDCHYHHH